MLPGYNVRKAAQVTAFFALLEGGKINVLKLAKLLYLTEREFMARFDAPMFYDRLVSMDHGPVASVTLNLINGNMDDPEWSRFVAGRDNYNIGVLSPDLVIEDLDELSAADLEVLQDLWAKFGWMDKYQIRDYTHQHCPEWEDPRGSSDPIPHERVFKYLGKPEAGGLVEDIEAVRFMARAFAEAQ